MLLSLTYLSEAIFVEIVNCKRSAFAEVARLKDIAPDFFDQTPTVAFREVPLEPYAHRRFDGASRVGTVVSVAPGLATAFELKLGTTRLTKTRVDDEWLAECTPSHGGSRWSGNMMAILERRFKGTKPERDLCVKVNNEQVYALTRSWYVVARRSVLDSWRTSSPKFSGQVQLLAFEDVVEAFGGKPAFNELVGELLNIDYYDAWIATPDDAG